MKRIAISVGTICLLAMAAQALAVNSTSQPSGRRQLMECMTKQMSASRTISYNEATKVCKDQIKLQGESVSSSNEAKPANAR